MQTEYILKAMDAALAAGKEILNVYNDPSSDFQVERKADNSPLTLADRKAHETIMTYLQETDYPVLSEEGKHLPYEKRAAMGYVVDSRSLGWNKGIYKTEWGIYCQYCFGKRRSSCFWSDLCSCQRNALLG